MIAFGGRGAGEGRLKGRPVAGMVCFASMEGFPMECVEVLDWGRGVGSRGKYEWRRTTPAR